MRRLDTFGPRRPLALASIVRALTTRSRSTMRRLQGNLAGVKVDPSLLNIKATDDWPQQHQFHRSGSFFLFWGLLEPHWKSRHFGKWDKDRLKMVSDCYGNEAEVHSQMNKTNRVPGLGGSQKGRLKYYDIPFVVFKCASFKTSYHLRQPLHCTAWIASDRPGLSDVDLGSVHPRATGFTIGP